METEVVTTAGPPPPVAREVPPALFLGIGLTLAIIYLRPLVPSFAVGMVVLAAGGVLLLPLAILERRWLGMTAAIVLVILSWLFAGGAAVRLLPESIRELAPYGVDSPLDGLGLILRRIVVLGPTAALAVGLALAQRESRDHLRAWFRVGSWRAPIRWPLPWWGVPPLPLWLLLLIGAPSGVAAFIPVIDWSATQARWAQLPVSLCLVIPLMALANAFLEEAIFRLGLMSLGSRVFSPATATIPAAILFGAVHVQGGLPSGLFSLLLLGFGGLWLGYFLLAEKGMSVAVVFHALMDVVVLSFVVK